MNLLSSRWSVKPKALWLAALTLWAVTASAGDRPTPFIAVYDVHYSGARIAETTVMLTRINRDSYSMSSTTHPRGFAALIRKNPVIEYSRFEFTERDQMHGIDYEFDDGSRSGKRNRSIRFDWKKSQARSVYKEVEHVIELDQAVGDRLAMQALLMRDLGEDGLRKSYQLLDRDQIKTYLFTPLGEQVLDTPAGRFQTVKIKQQREGSTRSYHIWLAREHDFAVVKMTQFKNDKARTVLTATRIESGVADHATDAAASRALTKAKPKNVAEAPQEDPDSHAPAQDSAQPDPQPGPQPGPQPEE